MSAFNAQEAIEHFKQANSELRSENGQLRAELASLRAERDALRARVAELETATDKAAEQIENGDIRIAHDVLRATNIGSATLTPLRCRTCKDATILTRREIIDRLHAYHEETRPETISESEFIRAWAEGYADPCGCALCQLMQELTIEEIMCNPLAPDEASA